MDSARRRRLYDALLVSMAVISILVVIANLLMGGSPATTIGATLTAVALLCLAAGSGRDTPTLGRRHAWLYGGMAARLLLFPGFFVGLRHLLALDRAVALAIALPTALIIACAIGAHGVRATQ